MVRDLDPAVQLIHMGTPLPLASTSTSLVPTSTNTQYCTYLLLEALSWTCITRLRYIRPLPRRPLEPASRSLDNFAHKGARKIGTPGPQDWSRKYRVVGVHGCNISHMYTPHFMFLTRSKFVSMVGIALMGPRH